MTRNLSRTLLVAGLGCLTALIFLQLNTNAAQKKDEKEKRILAEFMRKKLGASNRVLEGLVTEDFELNDRAHAWINGIVGNYTGVSLEDVQDAPAPAVSLEAGSFKIL